MSISAPLRSGVLEADAVWDGDVHVEGDLVIPEGRRLILRPGCRLTFAWPPRWSTAVFRSVIEGYPLEASRRELCDIVVMGRLEALGTAALSISMGPERRIGAAW